MLTAIRLSDNLKVVGEFIEKTKDESFTCEYCKKSVIHHRPADRVKVGHFKHKSGESFCPSQGESIEHIRAKLEIFNYISKNWGDKLKEIEIEKWISNRTIRPDIYIETKRGNKIAIEVQTTALTVTEIKRRTIKYFENKIYVLWVLPYERFRFLELRKDYGTMEDGNWGLTDKWYALRDKVRLKEYEIFLYLAYYKKLIFWDLDKLDSLDFIVVEFGDYRTDSKEYWKDGEEHYSEGRQTKVMKTIQAINKNVKFDQFKPTKGKLYNGRAYDIPERTIFCYFKD